MHDPCNTNFDPVGSVGLFWVFIDIDGTLLDCDDNVRPHTTELFERIAGLKGTIILWSGAGENYAKSKVRVLPYNTQQYVWLVMEKGDKREEALLGPRFIIDDDFDSLQREVNRRADHTYRGFKVPFYYNELGKDDTFLEVADDLEVWVERVVYKNKSGETYEIYG
jgi:hypothetical protein